MTDTTHPASQDRFDVAGDWLLRLQFEDVAQDEFAAWLQWYEADPKNRAAFDEAQSLFESARDLDAGVRARWANELLAGPRTDAPATTQRAAVRRISGVAARLKSLPRRRFALSAAMALAFAIGIVKWQSAAERGSAATLAATFQTPLATHRVETLPDGSEVRLGARSSISVSFSNDTRYVVMESGEALFKVAKERARPFIVHAGQVSVRAVGTEFNVRRAADSTTVAVSEGTVDVVQEMPNSQSTSAPASGRNFGGISARQREIRLRAGEEVQIDERSGPNVRAAALTVKAVDRAAISAWLDGRLEFVNEPLRLVVATVNRYSPREIVVTDQSLNELSITGSISEQHTEEWLRALPAIIPVRVVEVGTGTVLVSPLEGT